MRRLYLLLALLPLLFLSPYNALSEPSNGSGGGIGPGDIVVNGTVTADGFDANPDTINGGSVVLKECEGGTGCPIAAAGHQLSIQLPANANPLNTNKSYSPGYQARFAVSQAAFDSFDDGNHCLPFEPVIGTPYDCQASAANSRLIPRWGYPFVSGAFIDTCTISIPSLIEWNDGNSDKLVLQFVYFDAENVAGTAKLPFGDTFTVVDSVTTCGDLTPNCTTADGTYTWQVHESAADCNDADDPYDCCTASGEGATCSGATTEDQGLLGINILGASNDGGANADLSVSIICNYF